MRKLSVIFTSWLMLILLFHMAAESGNSYEVGNNSMLVEEFEKLKKVNSIEFSIDSLRILAQVNDWEYGMSFGMVKSMGGKSLDLKGKNPFYEDTEVTYRSFLKDLDLAHDKVGLNEELDMYRKLARWRLSELEKTAAERQQRKIDFDKRLHHAKTRADLEKLIQEYQDQRYVVHVKEKLENLFVSKIKGTVLFIDKSSYIC